MKTEFAQSYMAQARSYGPVEPQPGQERAVGHDGGVSASAMSLLGHRRVGASARAKTKRAAGTACAPGDGLRAVTGRAPCCGSGTGVASRQRRTETRSGVDRTEIGGRHATFPPRVVALGRRSPAAAQAADPRCVRRPMPPPDFVQSLRRAAARAAAREGRGAPRAHARRTRVVARLPARPPSRSSARRCRAGVLRLDLEHLGRPALDGKPPTALRSAQRLRAGGERLRPTRCRGGGGVARQGPRRRRRPLAARE